MKLKKQLSDMTHDGVGEPKGFASITAKPGLLLIRNAVCPFRNVGWLADLAPSSSYVSDQ